MIDTAYQKLKRKSEKDTVRNPENIRHKNLQSVAAQYDWCNMAPVYDTCLGQIKNSYQN